MGIFDREYLTGEYPTGEYRVGELLICKQTEATLQDVIP